MIAGAGRVVGGQREELESDKTYHTTSSPERKRLDAHLTTLILLQIAVLVADGTGWWPRDIINWQTSRTIGLGLDRYCYGESGKPTEMKI